MAPEPLYPLSLEPFLRPMPWGGQKLATWTGKDIPADGAIGEAWLLSDHALHASVISSGPLARLTLRELMVTHAAELLGSEARRFPLLVKLLDARERLSVQVHPDDAAAAIWAPLEGGKTEAWYVLESEPTAELYIGLKEGIDPDSLQHHLSQGKLPDCLERVKPMAGECYSIPAGTIHALGGGLLVLEVQQTSDATFRLHDWGRVDAMGRPRPLHIEAGLACLKHAPSGHGRQTPRRIQDDVERLVSCPYFHIDRVTISTSHVVSAPSILVGLEGETAVDYAGSTTLLTKGSLMLLPHALGSCILAPHQAGSFLLVGFSGERTARLVKI